MSNTEPGATFNRFAIPVKWGILVGVISIVLTTVNFMFLISNYMLFLICSTLIYIIAIVLYGIAGAQQRKAMGGYISFKEAFQAIFIVILISSFISTVYGILYVQVIDPGVTDTLKARTLAFMQRMNAPEEKLDEVSTAFDTEVARSLRPGRLLFSFAKQLVWQSIFGFVCALIVKRKRPVFPA